MASGGKRADRGIDGEDRWQPARLIPTSGIRGIDEQEKRATSALLSVMMAVPEFSRSLLRKANAPAGLLKTYIEPEFTFEAGHKVRPDGALVVRRGERTWVALLEVKTGTNELRTEQIENYLDIARERNFDAVITISNQLTAAAEEHPVTVDRRRTRKTALIHWSWVEILTEAVLQREHRGISDPDQAWILGELISYLKHPQSGAMQFQDMGPHWVAIREAARDGMLRAQDPGVNEVVLKWDQFIQYLCLHLAAELGVEVSQVLSRADRESPAARKQNLIKQLVQTKSLAGTIRIRNAVSPVTLTAVLDAKTISASIAITPPDSGRPLTRVTWLVRQLKGAPEHVVVASSFANVRESNSARLSDLLANPQRLLLADKKRSPRSFTISLMKNMGVKRSGTSGSFIGEATELLLTFYRTVVQDMRPATSNAPRLPTEPEPPDAADQPENVVDEVAKSELLAAHPASSAVSSPADD